MIVIFAQEIPNSRNRKVLVYSIDGSHNAWITKKSTGPLSARYNSYKICLISND